MIFFVLSLLSVLLITTSNAQTVVNCSGLSDVQIAPRHKIKFMAALLEDRAGTGWYRYRCTGVLISTRHILSVASCFQNESLQPSRWRVRLASEYSGSGGEVFAASSIKIHPDYDPHTKKNNIALVGIDEEIKLSRYIAVADLPLWDEEPEPGAFSKVSAWSGLSESKDLPPQVHEACRLVLNAENCRSKYDRIYNYVHNSTICVGDSNGICSGDEGSPLIIDDVVYGMASNFIRCCGSYPGVYTAISHFVDWIYENMSTEII